jgi:hypothetical protein
VAVLDALERVQHLAHGRLVALEQLQAELLVVAVRAAVAQALLRARRGAQGLLLEVVDVARERREHRPEAGAVVVDLLRCRFLAGHRARLRVVKCGRRV